MDFGTLAKVIGESPQLNKALSYEGVVTYIDLIRILKPNLSHLLPSHQGRPPESLPLATHDFLKLCLNLKDKIAKLAWHALHQIAWDIRTKGEDIHKHGCAHLKYLGLFPKYGPCCGIGV
jgi:hypothetical protein